MLILPEILMALLLVGSNELAETQGQPPDRSGRSEDKLGEFFGQYYPGESEQPAAIIAEENIGMRSLKPNQRPRINEGTEGVVMPSIHHEPSNTARIDVSTIKPQKKGADGGSNVMTFSEGESGGGGWNFNDESKPTRSAPVSTKAPNTEEIKFKAEPAEVLKCNSSEINYQGKCTVLLKQGPCDSDEWLVEIEGKPTCRKTQCHYPNIPWNGKCHTLLDLNTNKVPSGCPQGMVVVLSRDGSADCDCSVGNIYHATSGKCYPAFSKGPCVDGKYYILSPKRGSDGVATKQRIPTCVTNPCGDGKVCYGKNCPFVTASSKSCVDINSGCTKNSKPGLLRVNDETNTLKCVAIEDVDNAIRAIGNVPPFPCSPGSRRDATGKCRKATTFSFQ